MATATSDVTGFYFFATTGVLAPGAQYVVSITGLPAGFTASSSPKTLTWSGTSIALSDFILT